MRTLKLLTLIGLILLFFNYRFPGNPKNNPIRPPAPAAVITPTAFPLPTSSSGSYSSPVPDINNNQLSFKLDTQVYVSEVDWLNFVTNTLRQKGWSGKSSDKLPIGPADIPAELFSKLENKLVDLETTFIIPDQLRSLFISPDSQAEIMNLVLSSRNEYLEYLALKQVPNVYLEEIKTNALPPDTTRIRYFPEDGDTPQTAVEAYVNDQGRKEDYSKLQLHIYATDLYNDARSITQSGILGELPPETDNAKFLSYYSLARDIAIRYLTYHEMTHVLQRAVDSVTVEPKLRTTKVAWGRTEKSLWKSSPNYFLKWDRSDQIYADISNHDLSQESQAEGVAYEILSFVYNLSPVQKQLVWEFLFGRLSTARNQLDESLSIFENQFSDFSLDDIQQRIYDDIIIQYVPGSRESTILYRTNKRLSTLSSYVGYFHPMKPEDTPGFWEFLKNGP